jgi:Uncharacterized low-complexity proteins
MANMKGVIFNNAVAKRAIFKETNLSGATMNNSVYSLSDFTGANLSNVDIRESEMEGVSLHNAILTQARISQRTIKSICPWCGHHQETKEQCEKCGKPMTIPEPEIKYLDYLILFPILAIISGPLVFIATGIHFIKPHLIPLWLFYPLFQAGIMVTMLTFLMSIIISIILNRNPLYIGHGYSKSSLVLTVLNFIVYTLILV